MGMLRKQGFSITTAYVRHQLNCTEKHNYAAARYRVYGRATNDRTKQNRRHKWEQSGESKKKFQTKREPNNSTQRQQVSKQANNSIIPEVLGSRDRKDEGEGEEEKQTCAISVID